ncbi:hypothetical protein SBOR_1605 [Sclerotinia borealis F-4128]|uniref:Uncharacterized protein n=1 Tax=Sclerotinia borealis (strain F-4128) TaxID=1432307 RepID=W9CMH4_SCLBF|nr:hypothetical protein SBOR_1605 [Sclerotinia borealis F-4128]
MTASKALPLSLGFLALASETVMLTFNIIFSITISKYDTPNRASVSSYVASGLGAVTEALLVLLVIRQTRCQNYIQDHGTGRLRIYLFAGLTSVFTVLSAIATALSLCFMRQDLSLLPIKILSSPATSMTMGGFVIWAISLASQAVFLICLVVFQRKDFHQQIQPYITESEPHASSEMQERSQPHSVHEGYGYERNGSIESKTQWSTGGRSRSGSDPKGSIGSFRSTVSHVVRPITSKTRLIHSNSQLSNSFRPPSIDSIQREMIVSIEDDFDSWNTSGVDAQSRQVIESASPSLPRFLETIPASPTGSRSPSPEFPLDLEPPRPTRSRSYSPAASIRSERSIYRARVAAMGTESTNEENIHPLFRSDSPGPAPYTTAETIITAAPGAGSITLSDVRSIRSIKRLRSESLPPLMHNPSLDSLRRAIEQEDMENAEEAESERSLTPPIPEWILGAGPRSSMSEYNRKKAMSESKVGRADTAEY